VSGAADRQPVQAVTFDFWNTIVAESAIGASRGSRVSDELATLDVEATPEQVAAAFDSGWEWFVGRWKANEHTTTRESVAVSLSHLPVPVTDDAVVDAVTALVVAGSDPSTVTLAPGIGNCLETLASSGVQLGIICDVGMTPSSTLRGYLDHHGLLQHFSHWSFSDEVGCYKPDPRIFAHASEGLGRPEPARTAHVGDLRRTDVAGAQGVGWTAVRYHGLSDDPRDVGPEGDLVVAHHDDLPGALGIS